MLDSYLKTTYKRIFLRKVIKYGVRNQISPNSVTLISFISGMCIFPALYFQQFGLAILLLAISGYCDTLDGALARAANRTTASGTIFDIMSDRFVECSIILGLYAISPIERGELIVCMLVSMFICVTSLLVIGMFAQNDSDKSFYYSPGVIERAAAFVFFGAMICLPQYFSLLAVAFSALVLFTGLMRIAEFTLNLK